MLTFLPDISLFSDELILSKVKGLAEGGVLNKRRADKSVPGKKVSCYRRYTA